MLSNVVFTFGDNSDTFSVEMTMNMLVMNMEMKENFRDFGDSPK